jgi:glutaredoxin
MDKIVVVFTMAGCGFCEQFKGMLKEQNIDFVNRDINENKDEYDSFVKATGNDFVPSFMVIDSPNENPTSHLYAPGRDFQDLDKAVSIVKEHVG